MARVWKRLLHAVVLALVLPLSFSSAMPVFARALGGPAVHVCRCATQGSHGPATCACPVCNPDRDDLAFSSESIRGRCGDEDLAFGAALGSAVAPPAGSMLLRAELVASRPPHLLREVPTVYHAPPRRPPRLVFS